MDNNKKKCDSTNFFIKILRFPKEKPKFDIMHLKSISQRYVSELQVRILLELGVIHTSSRSTTIT